MGHNRKPTAGHLGDQLITFPCISSLSVSVTFRPPSKVISSLSDIVCDFRSLRKNTLQRERRQNPCVRSALMLQDVRETMCKIEEEINHIQDHLSKVQFYLGLFYCEVK